MPVPTLITELSTTANSNSPAGSESPVDGDNYLRAHGAFIAQLNANKIDKAGTVTPTANQPMGGYKHTGAAAGSASGQYTTFAQTGAMFTTLAVGTASPDYAMTVGGKTGLGKLGANGQYAVHFLPDVAGENIFYARTDAAGMAFGRGDPYSPADFLAFDILSNVITKLNTSAPSLGVNNQMVFNLTSDTNLRISVRGSDGVTRVANITLA